MLGSSSCRFEAPEWNSWDQCWHRVSSNLLHFQVQYRTVQYSTVQYSESKHLHFQTNYLLSCLLVIMTVTALSPVSMLLAVISIASGQCGV